MKILIVGEDIRLQSGISEVLRNIVKYGRKEDISFVHFGWAPNHPDKNTVVDLPEMRIYSIDSHDKEKSELLFEVIQTEHPDAIFLMGDPWVLKWIFKLDVEIRKYCPIVYYNVWDNGPTPHFNRGIYQSCDMLLAINQMTCLFNKELAQKVPNFYIPHGIDLEVYKPVSAEEVETFCIHRNIPTDKYKFLFDSVNIERKQLPAVITAFKKIAASKEDVILILKTNPSNRFGANVKELIKGIKNKVIIIKEYLSDEEMNLLYNTADCFIHVPSNEGWGLSVTKAITLGKQIICTSTGGISDQIATVKNGVYKVPAIKNMLSSCEVPYIYQDIVDNEKLNDAIFSAYNEKDSFKRNYNTTFSAEKMATLIIEKIKLLVEKWFAIPLISINKFSNNS